MRDKLIVCQDSKMQFIVATMRAMLPSQQFTRNQEKIKHKKFPATAKRFFIDPNPDDFLNEGEEDESLEIDECESDDDGHDDYADYFDIEWNGDDNAEDFTEEDED